MEFVEREDSRRGITARSSWRGEFQARSRRITGCNNFRNNCFRLCLFLLVGFPFMFHRGVWRQGLWALVQS